MLLFLKHCRYNVTFLKRLSFFFFFFLPQLEMNFSASAVLCFNKSPHSSLWQLALTKGNHCDSSVRVCVREWVCVCVCVQLCVLMRAREPEWERHKDGEGRGTLEWECVTRALCIYDYYSWCVNGYGCHRLAAHSEVCTCVRGREGAVNLHLCASALMFHFLNTTRLLSGAGALTGLNKTLSHY